MKTRIAIVVQRCHQDIVGGSESLAWQYATLLRSRYDVDVLTAAASDYVTWNNDLPVGDEVRDGIVIRRFRVERGRGDYFGALWNRLRADLELTEGAPADARLTWPEALEEEFVRSQGPHCPALHAHLAAHGDDYAAVIFLTYLYPTTFDAVRVMPHRRWLLVPTAHDEPAAYLRTIADMARRSPRLLWNTHAEAEIGARLWGVDHGTVVSMTVETDPVPAARESRPYLLYCGRIDVNKGSPQLLDGFRAWKERHPGHPLELVLTGHDVLGIGSRESVRYLGFVDERRKLELMAGAVAFVQPSPYESLSIVLLEAMAQCTPVIVNGRCEALLEHVDRSGSGFAYHAPDAFGPAIDAVLALDDGQRAEHGTKARDYVLANFGREEITRRLVAEVEALARR